jgi:hypothetical protein
MPKINGPRDGDILTAVFNGKTNGRLKSRFPSLLTTKDLVLLSIHGNEYCTGDYLEALVQYAVTTHSRQADDSKTDGKTTFLIADEIYWHNLKQLPPHDNIEEELKAQALTLGDKFFYDNLKHFLKPLAISMEIFNDVHGKKTIDQQIEMINMLAHSQGKNFEIMRWRTWVNQEDVAEQITQMMPLYELEPGLQTGIEKDVHSFVSRHADDLESSELLKYRSRSYLIEESPSIMWLAAYLGYNFIIYPGKILASFTATKEFFIVKNHEVTIFDGKSVEDICTHNPLSLHAPYPDRLVNWLEPNFVRSYSTTEKKIDAIKDYRFFTPAESSKSSQSVPLQEQMTITKIEPVMQGTKRGIDEQLLNTSDATDLVSSHLQYEIIEALIARVLLALSTNKTMQAVPEDGTPNTNLVELFQKFTTDLLQINIPNKDKQNILNSLSGSFASNKDTDSEGCKKIL